MQSEKCGTNNSIKCLKKLEIVDDIKIQRIIKQIRLFSYRFVYSIFIRLNYRPWV